MDANFKRHGVDDIDWMISIVSLFLLVGCVSAAQSEGGKLNNREIDTFQTQTIQPNAGDKSALASTQLDVGDKPAPIRDFFSPPVSPFVEVGDGRELMPITLYLMGWSPNGYVAYVVVQEHDAAGVTEISLHVHNVYSNTIEETLDSIEFADIEQFWGAHGEAIHDVLLRYEINGDTGTVHPLPLIIDGNRVDIVVENRSDTTQHSSVPAYQHAFSSPSAVRINVKYHTGKQKLIFEKSFASTVEMEAVGVLVNPFDETMGVAICRYLSPGQHGTPPHYMRYILVGARF